MVQSAAYQEILQEGEMIGISKGKVLGIQEGEMRGIERGIERGIGKGKVLGIEEGKKEDILEILGERFGYVSSKLEREVKGLQGMKVCEILFRKAINVPSIEEFKELLERVKQEV